MKVKLFVSTKGRTLVATVSKKSDEKLKQLIIRAYELIEEKLNEQKSSN